MQEKRPLPNYGSTSTTETVPFESKNAPANTQVRERGWSQTYTLFPLVNDVIHFGVGQFWALFNQQRVAVPSSHGHLKQIWDNNDHPCLPLMIQALTASTLSDDNSQVFISLINEVLTELDGEKMENKIKEDFIFVLKSGLSIFEGDDKVKIIRAIKCFEDAIKKSELVDARSIRF